MVRPLVRDLDHVVKLRDPQIILRRNERDLSKLQELQLVPQFLLKVRLFLVRRNIPLVHDDDNRAARLVGIPRDVSVQVQNPFARINDDQRHVGHSDVPLSHHHAQLFRIRRRLALAPNTRRIYEYKIRPAMVNRLVHGISRRPRHRAHNAPLRSDNRVDQGRLADIRSPDDRHLNFLNLRRLFVSDFRLLFNRKVFSDVVEQFMDPHFVLRRNSKQRLNTQFVKAHRQLVAFLGVDLVHRQHHGLAQLLQHLRQIAVRRRDLRPPVNQKHHPGGGVQRKLGLLQNLSRNQVVIVRNDSARINNFEFAPAVRRDATDAVARNARLIVNDRAAGPSNGIKKRRFADVRPTDNNYDRKTCGFNHNFIIAVLAVCDAANDEKTRFVPPNLRRTSLLTGPASHRARCVSGRCPLWNRPCLE